MMSSTILASGSRVRRTLLKAKTIPTTAGHLPVPLREAVHKHRLRAGQLQVNTEILASPIGPSEELSEVVTIGHDVNSRPVERRFLAHFKTLVYRDYEREENGLGHFVTVLVAE